MKYREVTLSIAVFLIAIGGSLSIAQDGKPKSFTPTELQTLRLQVKQKDALLAKNLLEQAQNNFLKALSDLQAEGDKVKQENGWKDVSFNPSDLTFSVPEKKDVPTKPSNNP